MKTKLWMRHGSSARANGGLRRRPWPERWPSWIARGSPQTGVRESQRPGGCSHWPLRCSDEPPGYHLCSGWPCTATPRRTAVMSPPEGQGIELRRAIARVDSKPGLCQLVFWRPARDLADRECRWKPLVGNTEMSQQHSFGTMAQSLIDAIAQPKQKLSDAKMGIATANQEVGALLLVRWRRHRHPRGDEIRLHCQPL